MYLFIRSKVKILKRLKQLSQSKSYHRIDRYKGMKIYQLGSILAGPANLNITYAELLTNGVFRIPLRGLFVTIF